MLIDLKTPEVFDRGRVRRTAEKRREFPHVPDIVLLRVPPKIEINNFLGPADVDELTKIKFPIFIPSVFHTHTSAEIYFFSFICVNLYEYVVHSSHK